MDEFSDDDNLTTSHEREIIQLLKEVIREEKHRDMEIRTLLNEHITYISKMN